MNNSETGGSLWPGANERPPRSERDGKHKEKGSGVVSDDPFSLSRLLLVLKSLPANCAGDMLEDECVLDAFLGYRSAMKAEVFCGIE